MIDYAPHFVALVSAIVGAYTTIKLKKLDSKNKESSALIKEHEEKNAVLTSEVRKSSVERLGISLLFDYKLYEIICEEVEYLFEQTKVERFLILFAVNGKEQFNFVTVAIEKTKSAKTSGAIARYVRLHIDNHYKDLLKIVERDGLIALDVENMPQCMLKDIYQAPVEGVTHSVVGFLNRISISDIDDMVVYCSIGTTQKGGYDRSEMINIRARIDKLKSYMSLLKAG